MPTSDLHHTFLHPAHASYITKTVAMARLRKPSSAEPPIFIPPATTSKPTRSSPRKTVRESPSTRELRYTSSQDPEESFLVPKATASTSPVRKQRVLRPVASNSRLLRKISDESLAATPDRKERRERGIEGRGQRGLYSKTLAKSVARKQQGLRKIEVGVESESVAGRETVVEEEEELERSVFCGDEEGEKDEGDKENAEDVVEEEDSEDEDDEPVMASRQRRRQPHARRVVSDSEEDSEEDEPITNRQRIVFSQEAALQPVMAMPPPLSSARPPHRKGHSTISNWAQEVIDLTSSPEPPASFEPPPPTRTRTASFAASSRPTSSASNDADAMLRLYVVPKLNSTTD